MRERRFDRVARTIRGLIAQGDFPCAAVEIGNVNGPVWRFAEGLRQVKPMPLPVNEETLFDMASVTKVFSTAMLVLSLMEDGELSPGDSLGLFWDGLPDTAARVTLHQLLTHTSGLPGGVSIVGMPRNDLAPAILSGPFAYAPGMRVQYACLGYLVLGELLERVTKKTLDVLAQERVFAPLRMKHTGYAPEGENIAATSLTPPERGVVQDYNARYLGRPAGNAGVFSNLEDCGAFCRMLLREGAPLLSPATLQAANQDYTPFCGEARGWGFYRFRRGENPVCEVCSPLAYGHSGWTGTSVMADPHTGLYLALLTNRTCVARQDERAIWRARRLIHNAAVAAYMRQEE